VYFIQPNIPDNPWKSEQNKEIIFSRNAGNFCTCLTYLIDHLIFPWQKINTVKLETIFVMKFQSFQ
ncbi:MAG: hypothetical protein N2044_12555, partial [Cyclobacteriaceae bacterium]|nr:hypothetical protein [Cyclobacteriaceae bacterium]